jgi:hypothetical protein
MDKGNIYVQIGEKEVLMGTIYQINAPSETISETTIES